MISNHGNIQRRLRASILGVACISVVLGGCANAGPETEVSTPTSEVTSPAPTNGINATAQPTAISGTPQPSATSGVSDSEGIPTGVSIKRVIKEVNLNNGYNKKIELLTDGGKRVTITDSNQNIVLRQLEYDGIIVAANGNEVTVKVDGGGEKTITIPNEVVIEDEDMLGLKKGIEIEWTVDIDGRIESVELED